MQPTALAEPKAPRLMPGRYTGRENQTHLRESQSEARVKLNRTGTRAATARSSRASSKRSGGLRQVGLLGRGGPWLFGGAARSLG